MSVLAKRIAQALIFIAAVLTFITVSRYLSLDPDVYFPEQVEVYQSHQASLLFHVGGGMLAAECWRRNVGGGMLAAECWRRNVGGGMLAAECWRGMLR